MFKHKCEVNNRLKQKLKMHSSNAVRGHDLFGVGSMNFEYVDKIENFNDYSPFFLDERTYDCIVVFQKQIC